MIVRGGQRSNGGQLADYFLSLQDNSSVRILEASFAFDHTDGEAFRSEFIELEQEAFQSSKSALFKEAWYHAQINPEPPFDKQMSDADWIRAADILAEKQGLSGHERKMVLQEKNGRIHLHVAWCRLNPETGKIAELPFNYARNVEAQREISIALGHPITASKFDGSLDMGRRAPDYDEKQMSERAGYYARDLIKEAWEQSDNGWAFRAALEDKGLILANGRRGVMAIDQAGGKHLLHRRLSKEFPHLRKADVVERTKLFAADLPTYKEAQTPLAAIDQLFKRKAIVSEAEITRQLSLRGFGIDDADRLIKNGDLIQLADPKTGHSTSLFTTRTVRDEEINIITRGQSLDRRERHSITEDEAVQIAIDKGLSQEQAVAMKHLTDEGDLKVLEAAAGTGKSYMLNAAREAWEREGYHVIGASFTNNVVNALSKDGFSDARTVHALLHAHESGSTKAYVPRDAVIVVDEAGQIDNQLMTRTLKMAEETGSKLVLVGDRRQLESISRGGMFAELSDNIGHASLSEIRRQSRDWDRKAAEAFSEYRFRDGLELYDDNDRISWNKNIELAKEQLIETWAADTKDGLGKRFVFAQSNEVVDALNEELQAIRIERGQLEDGYEYTYGERTTLFHSGDRVLFKTTDKKRGMARGMLGEIEAIDGDIFTVLADNGKRLEIDMATGNSPDLRLGYAGTIYGGQGKTLDRTYLLHQRNWKDQSSYVAMTRAKEGARLFVSRGNAKNIDELAALMGEKSSLGASIQYKTVGETTMIDTPYRPSNDFDRPSDHIRQDVEERTGEEKAVAITDFERAEKLFREYDEVYADERAELKTAMLAEMRSEQDLKVAREQSDIELPDSPQPEFSPRGMSTNRKIITGGAREHAAQKHYEIAADNTIDKARQMAPDAIRNEHLVNILATYDRLDDGQKANLNVEQRTNVEIAKLGMEAVDRDPKLRKGLFGSETVASPSVINDKAAEYAKKEEKTLQAERALIEERRRNNMGY